MITSGSCVAVVDHVRRRFEIASVPTTAGSSAPRSAGPGPSSCQQGGRWERTAAVVAPPAAAESAPAACRDAPIHTPGEQLLRIPAAASRPRDFTPTDCRNCLSILPSCFSSSNLEEIIQSLTRFRIGDLRID